MRTKAAILVETGKPLLVDEIEMPALLPGQVLVEVHFSGVCHTQLLEARGHRGADNFLPHCLGHEGSGIVKELGAGVTKVKQDDPVILSWMKGSGSNVAGSKYEWNGKKVNAGAITTFSRYAVISENRLTVIPKDFPLKQASLLGCALPTGLGAVFNTARPSPGQSIAIFGCGGIGLSSVQGAAIAGCFPIIAVDINPEKLLLAKAMGATHLLKEFNLEPVDFAIEATGRPSIMEKALSSVKQQGGCAVIIGNARYGERLSLDPKEFNAGKRLFGTWGGDNVPDIHFPRYCNLVKHGYFKVEPFLDKVYSLDAIEEALSDLENGRVLRPIIEL